MGASRNTVRNECSRRAVELVAASGNQSAGPAPKDDAVDDPLDGAGDRTAEFLAGMAHPDRLAWPG